MTLDKLPGIRADLIRRDEDLRVWNFPHSVHALRKWTTKNPKIIPNPEKGFKREKAYYKNLKKL